MATASMTSVERCALSAELHSLHGKLVRQEFQRRNVTERVMVEKIGRSDFGATRKNYWGPIRDSG